MRECIETNWVSYLGSYVDRFERELAAAAGASHAVAMNSGTSALHIALLISGVEAGTEVVMPAVSFVSPANAVRYCGAWPAFIDISPRDWQLDVDKLAGFLAGCRPCGQGLINPATGRRVAALLPVHLLGGMGDVDAVAGLAAHHGLPIVEDAAECLGASFRGRPIAAPCSGMDLSRRLVITSFNGNKIITTGGGGAVLAEDAELAARARHISTTAKAPGLEFFHDEVGYNYRLTNVAAAMGVAQLEVLGEYFAAKRGIASRYAAAFAEDDRVTSHVEPTGCESSFWMYTVLLDRPAGPVVRDLNARGIGARPVWQPLPTLPAFREDCYAHEVEFAPAFYAHGLSLPCSVGLSEADQQIVIEAVRKAFECAGEAD